MAPSKEAAAAVASTAGEVWEKALKGVGVGTGGGSGGGLTNGVVSGVLGGVVGSGGAGTNGATFASKASVTVVLKSGGYIR